MAYAISVGVHIAVVLLAVTVSLSPSAPPPLVRLVFMEPPPQGFSAQVPAPPVEAPPPEKKKEKPPQPAVRKPHRVPVREPRPMPEPVPALVPETAAMDQAEQTSSASVFGYAEGSPDGRGAVPMPADQVARPPVLVHREMPKYPEVARRRGIEGLVQLEAILDEAGRVEEQIRVLQSLPDLDQAAIDAVRRWRFAPARDAQGQAVRVILEVPIRFVLR